MYIINHARAEKLTIEWMCANNTRCSWDLSLPQDIGDTNIPPRESNRPFPVKNPGYESDNHLHLPMSTSQVFMWDSGALLNILDHFGF